MHSTIHIYTMTMNLKSFVTNLKRLITRNNTISGIVGQDKDSQTSQHLPYPLQMLDPIQYMEYKMEANPNATNSELDAKQIIRHNHES